MFRFNHSKYFLRALALILGCALASTPAALAQEASAEKAENYLTLPAAIELAVENNPSATQTWQLARAAWAQRYALSGRTFLPTVNLNYTLQRSNTQLQQAGTTRQLETVQGPGITANWRLFDFGANFGAASVAYNVAKAADFTYAQALNSVRLNAVRAYTGALAAQANLNAAEANLREARALNRAAGIRFESGLASDTERLEAEARLHASRFDRQSAQANLEAARAQLAAVLGLDMRADALPTLPAVTDVSSTQTQTETTLWPGLETGLAEAELEDLMQRLQAEHPSLQVARSNVSAAKAGVRAVRSQWLPTVDVVASAQHVDVRGESGTRKAESIALVASWNIFDGGSNYNTRRAAFATRRVAEAGLVATQQSLASNLWAQFYRARAAVRQIESARAAKGAAAKVLQGRTTAYEEGLVSLTDWLSAQDALSAARARLIAAQAAQITELAALAHAVGQFDAFEFTKPANEEPSEGAGSSSTAATASETHS